MDTLANSSQSQLRLSVWPIAGLLACDLYLLLVLTGFGQKVARYTRFCLKPIMETWLSGVGVHGTYSTKMPCLPIYSPPMYVPEPCAQAPSGQVGQQETALLVGRLHE